jgi:hypothetical protein
MCAHRVTALTILRDSACRNDANSEIQRGLQMASNSNLKTQTFAAEQG